LDLELSHRVGDLSSHPFSQGTPGFVSPQQVAGETPAFSDDIFALGSLMINLFTGLDPRRVLYATAKDLADKLCILSGAPRSMCRVAGDCVAADPNERPSLEDLAESLEGAFREVAQSEVTFGQDQRRATRRFRRSGDVMIGSAIKWLLDGAPRDPVSCLWVSPELEASNHDATMRVTDPFRVYRSASRGVAGVVYVLARLHRFGFSAPSTAAHVQVAIDWLLSHEYSPDDQMPGLHFGEAGVAVAISEAIRAGLIERADWFVPYLREALAGPLDWPDLTHGAAGQGLAALICARLVDDESLEPFALKCVEYLLERQEADGSWLLPKGVEGLEGTIYTGFAHGVAGIVYFLARYARCSGMADASAAAMRGGAWLLEKARRSEDGQALWWPIRLNSSASWRWWCHGSPGIALALLALFEVSREDRYAVAARASLAIHPVDVRYNNLSQCHGLSGLGEILLEAYRVLGEGEWLSRAERIGTSLWAASRKDASGVSWLVENPIKPTADLMIGCAGVVHFLARLQTREKPTFGMPLLS
jgi:hypothetical protein